MVFVKHFNGRGGNHKTRTEGSAIFCDGKITIRLPSTKKVVESGITEVGFGVVTKDDDKAKKAPYTLIITKYAKEDLPPELRGQSYKYRIYGVKVSEDEFLFPFNNATMMNKK